MAFGPLRRLAEAVEPGGSGTTASTAGRALHGSYPNDRPGGIGSLTGRMGGGDSVRVGVAQRALRCHCSGESPFFSTPGLLFDGLVI